MNGPTPSPTAPGPVGVRTTFNPSPIGPPSIGLMRAALLNWVFARHHGGTFVLRIEDTDAARDSQEFLDAQLEGLRWLGLDWDEGPQVGGPHEPYQQSKRRDRHLEAVRALQAKGELYESFSTPEEVAARRTARGQSPRLGYDNADRDLTPRQRAVFRAEGRVPVLRLRMPDRDIVYEDMVRGEFVFKAGATPDPVMVRANGDPLFALANPVDDAEMGITHIVRGDDLLPTIPRHIAVFEALMAVGIASFVPRFGHIPPLWGADSKKLTRQSPESNLFQYREEGFLPEALINYLASLAWSHSEQREIYSLAEMVADFDVRRIRVRPSRFDRRKADSVNTAHLRALSTVGFATGILPLLIRAGLLPKEPGEEQLRLLEAAAPMAQRRVKFFPEAVRMLTFLFCSEEQFTADLEDAEAERRQTDGKRADGSDADLLAAVADALSDLAPWTKQCITQRLEDVFAAGGHDAKSASSAVRFAVCGRRVSLPLYESLELLGPERSLSRIDRALRIVRKRC